MDRTFVNTINTHDLVKSEGIAKTLLQFHAVEELISAQLQNIDHRKSNLVVWDENQLHIFVIFLEEISYGIKEMGVCCEMGWFFCLDNIISDETFFVAVR